MGGEGGGGGPSNWYVTCLYAPGDVILHIDRHAPERMNPLRENNLPLLPSHPPPRHPISTCQVVAPGYFRDWSLVKWEGLHCWQ